jgi:acetolactate synthase-1/2/3 large subunit
MIKYSGLNLRQFGVQEVDIIPIVKPLTKFAMVLDNCERIKFELDFAYHRMLSGRQGPVWLDIPMDIASAKIPKQSGLKLYKYKSKVEIKEAVSILKEAKKPLIVAGGGIKSADARGEFKQVIDKFNIPVVVTKMGIDLIEYDHPCYVGHGGIKGNRYGNKAVQTADLILSIGSRLAPAFTGHEFDMFAPTAKKIVVDIDGEEHKKKTIKIDLFIYSDAKVFLKELLKQKLPKYDSWCRGLKEKYPISLEYKKKIKEVNVYKLVDRINDYTKKGDIIITDAGATAYIVSQTLKVKKDQRVIIPAASLTMGYNLPAIVGAWVVNKKSNIICITGDGSFQLNIQELQTIVHHNIPVKIFVTNNKGYLAIRTTQKGYFGNLIGESKKSGVSFPSLKEIAYAYNISYFRIKDEYDLERLLPVIFELEGTIICEVMCPGWQKMLTVSSKKLPNGKMVSLPIDQMAPFI